MEPQPGLEPTRESTKAKAPRRPLTALPAPFRYSAANQACWYLGVAILATGLVGFVVPGLFYMHLNPTHNLIFIFTAVAALVLGIFKPDYVAKRVCIWLGGFYTLMGIAGFAFGTRQLSLTRPTVSGMPQETSFLWKLIPGRFELGTVDHSFHLIVGLTFLLAAYFTLRDHASYENKTWH
jgi:hypothetical protein